MLGTRPRNLKEVYESSNYQEMLVELKKKQKLKPHTQPNIAKTAQFNKNNVPRTAPSGLKSAKEEKKCYTCHAPWAPGHKCNSKSINTIEADPAEEEAWPEGVEVEQENELENIGEL